MPSNGVNPGWPSRMYVEVEFADLTPDHMETPMTKTNMDLSELLAKHDQGELSAQRCPEARPVRLIMEADVEGP